MKNIFVLVLFTLFAVIATSQNQPKSYTETIIQSTDTLEAAESTQDIQQARRRFASIVEKNPEKWVPLYYSAVSDIYLVLFNFMSRTHDDALTDVKDKITRIAGMEGADASEIYTLWAFYYLGIIVTNIPENGPKYYQTVINYSIQAMQENPSNPRPILLLAVFEQYLPDGVKTGRDYCTEVKRSEALFKKESPSADNIYFGKSFLNIFKRDCN